MIEPLSEVPNLDKTTSLFLQCFKKSKCTKVLALRRYFTKAEVPSLKLYINSDLTAASFAHRYAKSTKQRDR
jgi:hypothetical protein